MTARDTLALHLISPSPGLLPARNGVSSATRALCASGTWIALPPLRRRRRKRTSVLDGCGATSDERHVETTMKTFTILPAALLGCLLSGCALTPVEDENTAAVNPGDDLSEPVGATGVAASALASTIPESVAVGTSVDLDAYAAEEGFALPPGQAMIDIVGIAIATANDHIYAWFADG